jgi:hypothetical protein
VGKLSNAAGKGRFVIIKNSFPELFHFFHIISLKKQKIYEYNT